MNISTIISIVVVVVLLLMLQINSLNSLFFLAVALSWSVKRQPGSAHSTRLDLESVADGVGPELLFRCRASGAEDLPASVFKSPY